MPITAKQSHALLSTAFNGPVKRLRGAFQKICRGYRRCMLSRHLRHLDRDDLQIHASVQHERLYLASMESSANDMFKANNRRRYSLQRRIMDLDMEEL